jgi:hypothetical protein
MTAVRASKRRLAATNDTVRDIIACIVNGEEEEVGRRVGFSGRTPSGSEPNGAGRAFSIRLASRD